MIYIQGKSVPMNVYITKNRDLYNQISSVLAYTSNYIENNKLTFPQTKQIITTGPSTQLNGVELKDVYEADNHNEAFAFMLNEINYQDDLTIDLIIDINRLINSRIINPAQLGLRTIPVEIRNTDVVTTEPHLIKEQLQSLLEKYNLLFKESVDFKDLAQFHEEFETIHPFIDGNGRTGRLLINFYLIKNQLAPTYINDSQKEQYYDCLSKKDYQQCSAPHSLDKNGDFFMTKFTNELKIKIIKDYISGMQLTRISKKYNINISYLNYIIALFRFHGYDGLISCKKFTPQMKLKLINEVEKGNTIYSIAVKYRLSSPGILYSWIKKYNTLGIIYLRNLEEGLRCQKQKNQLQVKRILNSKLRMKKLNV